MSDPVSVAKDAVAEVKSAVVHTPGMLEGLVSKVEAAFAYIEAQAAGAVQAVEKSLDGAADAKDAATDKDAAAAAAKDAPVPGAADDEPVVVKEVADGAK